MVILKCGFNPDNEEPPHGTQTLLCSPKKMIFNLCSVTLHAQPGSSFEIKAGTSQSLRLDSRPLVQYNHTARPYKMGLIQNSKFLMWVQSESLPNTKDDTLQMFKHTHQNTQSCSIQPVCYKEPFFDINNQLGFVHLLVLCIADQLMDKDLKALKRRDLSDIIPSSSSMHRQIIICKLM